jgi:multidrug efflux pump subunit AcrA (membrane-fusion protein)
MDAEVDVVNPGLTLIPGMYAEVNLRVDERRDVLSVPLDAVDRGGASPRIYTVTAVNTLHIVPVTLGLENDQRVEVKSGLRDGEVVVVGKRAGMKEGQRLQIKTLQAQVR